MESVRPATSRKHLEVMCPHCWHPFVASQTMAVAMQSSLGVDLVAAADDNPNVRFLPSRFSIRGIPLDPSGAECLHLACPQCHLMLSRANLVAQPLFVSIVGAPRAGKTFLLTAAVRRLRTTLRLLGCKFGDASTFENRVLEEYAQRLFEPADPREVIESLGSTHPMTPANSVVVRIRGEEQRLLKPFQFHFVPGERVLPPPQRSDPRALVGRVIALYDNPGQDHLAGNREGLGSIRHIAHAKVVVFVLNPLSEKRLRERCDQEHPLVRDPTAEEMRAESKPAMVLSELITRIATFKGRSPNAPLDARVVIVISKSDLFPEMYELIRPSPSGVDLATPVGDSQLGWVNRMNDVSNEASRRLEALWPEFMELARNADAKRSPKVFPVSIVDPDAAKQARNVGGFALTGEMIRPVWVEVPFFWSITRSIETPFTGERAGDPRKDGPSR